MGMMLSLEHEGARPHIAEIKIIVPMFGGEYDRPTCLNIGFQQ